MERLHQPGRLSRLSARYIDPRGWMHLGEKGFTSRLVKACKDLGSFGKFDF